MKHTEGREMDNKDMPAMPATIEISDLAWRQAKGCGIEVDKQTHYTGLTKREHFAGLAMQGICSSPEYIPIRDAHFSRAAEDAVTQADALLKALADSLARG